MCDPVKNSLWLINNIKLPVQLGVLQHHASHGRCFMEPTWMEDTEVVSQGLCLSPSKECADPGSWPALTLSWELSPLHGDLASSSQHCVYLLLSLSSLLFIPAPATPHLSVTFLMAKPRFCSAWIWIHTWAHKENTAPWLRWDCPYASVSFPGKHPDPASDSLGRDLVCLGNELSSTLAIAKAQCSHPYLLRVYIKWGMRRNR